MLAYYFALKVHLPVPTLQHACRSINGYLKGRTFRHCVHMKISDKKTGLGVENTESSHVGTGESPFISPTDLCSCKDPE